ncbi:MULTISPECIES: NADPH:quinone oxidoreductase family protein [unclassified Polaribacter]|uniref:NADPH:quinone oxidoreductase family protein n=1 Tax=unclassified Polaribacter TaxID=196858 RepID=UPI0011BE4BB4|nr:MULTISPECIES: NADPH:quinone oxidoreductase family protein [unclassified Polaribacter]TXD51659.1 NADPH:quinone oxidoreductase family protein [Polaribacter sp. IC063]TXD58819.1 NADPH:quinone oxidoreductase family protein [Polaribacter sp. IC066]
MKAIVCNKFGTPDTLQYQEIENPAPKKEDVLIAVKACSVNFPDTLIVQGKYQFKPAFPFSPGSDVAGIVEKVGEAVKHFKVGDEVVGFIPFGGFAEKAIVKAKDCFPKPKGMSMVNASAFLLAYGTSYHALKDRANLQKGETILILGASGGVGLTALELSKLMGAKVIAAASTKEKLDLCKQFGADEVINYTEENLKDKVKELTNGNGVDVIYDPVGGHFSELALRAIGWKGRHLVIGFANGEIPKIPINLTLLKGASIVGVFWGAFAQKEPKKSFDNIQQLLTWFAKGDLKPHIDTIYALKDAPKALEAMMNRKTKGKIVINMEL